LQPNQGLFQPGLRRLHQQALIESQQYRQVSE
jgi:hypothetical protein